MPSSACPLSAVSTSSCSICKQTPLPHPQSHPKIHPPRYKIPFLQETYLHHITRVDHRHNFSPYNTQLYLTSALPFLSSSSNPQLRIESIAFLPQLLLSCVLIPLVLAKKDLPTTMLAQTFAFVTFNKVCTSQVSHPSPFPAPSRF